MIPYIPFQRLTRCQDGAGQCQPVGVGAGWFQSVRVGAGWYRLVRVGVGRCRLVRVGVGRYQAVPAGESRYRLLEVGEIGNVGYNPCGSVQDCNTVYTSQVACSVLWPFPILLPMTSLYRCCHDPDHAPTFYD